MVERELERPGKSGQLPAPVSTLSLEDVVAEPLALPEREVHVLDRQLRQRRGALSEARLVERGEVPGENTE